MSATPTPALDATTLVQEAMSQTGLADFGDDGFREGLEVYVDAVNHEAALSELGVLSVQATIVGSLANRLRINAWISKHPAVQREQIEQPLVVIGMFRAGTTLLSNLLDQDAANRSLLRWEAMDSAPPPTPAAFRAGPRVDACREGIAMLDALNPNVRAIHNEDADGPTECVTVLGQDFKSLSWEAITNVPSYSSWLLANDHTSAYRHHREVLQVLQSNGVRGRWTLKSPHHAIALEALTDVYPDAHLVLLHRDPTVLSASVCSLISTLSGTFSDADHRAYIAEHWVDMLATSVDRIESFRTAHPEHPILDVQYADLVRDPVDTLAAIYNATGSELTDAARSAVERYVAQRPKGHFGTHRYDLADFGLDPSAISERFGPYIDRYAIEPESPR